MKFAFYVSGKASRLRKVLEHNEALLSDTRLVVSDSMDNADLTSALSAKGIRYICVSYQKLGGTPTERRVALSSLLQTEMDQFGIDMCFCFGAHILVEPLLSIYKNKIINFHPSVLPAYPGQSAIDTAYKANCFLYGNTAHFVREKVDAGPIIMQSAVVLSPEESLDYNTILDMQIPMLVQLAEWLKAGRVSFIKDRVYISGAKYKTERYFPPLDVE